MRNPDPDNTSTFEAYLRARWGVNKTRPVRSDGSDAVANIYPSAELLSGTLPQLRWLLTQSAGTVADAAHQLEIHPFDVDDRAREQLRDDVLVIEEELSTLKRLLAVVDWDAELQGLLGEQNSPPDTDTAPEDE